MMRRLLCCCCLVFVNPLICISGEIRTWTDKSGKFKVVAELISAEGGIATLRNAEGKEFRRPFEIFSEADRKFLEARQPVVRGNPKTVVSASSNAMTTFRELEAMAREQRDATFVLAVYDGFLKTDGIAATEKDKVFLALPEWRERASIKAIRLGNKWMSPDEAKRAREDEIRLIKEAHRLIDIKNDDLAKEKFVEASHINPEAVRADFYMGLLNALVAHYPTDSDKYFRECVNRLKRDEDLLSSTRRANYVAALNNLAIIQVRLRRYQEAIGYWRRALDVAPFTPELVQNLGLMSALSQSATYVRIPKELRRSAGNLYSKATVDNSLARFDHSVGWLFLPYVDSLDGSEEESGDQEMINVGHCTGFSVGGEYILTSRYPLEDADRIVIRDGGNSFETPTGKVVALSDDSHLVVVRIEGLNGKLLPLNPAPTRPGQDVIIPGYGNPGLAATNAHRRVATILDPPRVYQNVDIVVHQQVGPGVNLYVHGRGGLRQLMMHDAITDPGLEGAPLIDKKGSVVGVHLGNRPQFGRFGSKHSWAESAPYILDRIASVTNEVNIRVSDAQNAPPLDEKKVDDLLAGCVFQLAVQKRAPRLAWSHRIEEVHRLQQQGSWTSYEDKTCMACNGRLQMECPNRGCVRGKFKRKERELKYTDPNTGNEIWGHRVVVEKCTVCDGKGVVECANCDGHGIDRMLQ